MAREARLFMCRAIGLRGREDAPSRDALRGILRGDAKRALDLRARPRGVMAIHHEAHATGCAGHRFWKGRCRIFNDEATDFGGCRVADFEGLGTGF